MKIARRIRNIQPFYVMAVLERASAMERAGVDIVHMEIGEPDFPTPRTIVEAGRRFMDAGEVRYTPAAGLPALREAIARWYMRRYDVVIPAHRIFVTPGATGALLLALSFLIEPGSRVLLTDPGYPCYANVVRLFEGEPVGIPVDATTDFQVDAELVRAYTKVRPAGIIAGMPSNPTGSCPHAREVAKVITLMENLGGFFLADEIYHGLEYGKRAPTALAFSDQVFVVNSFSKYFGMTGWRLGWLVAPEKAVPHLEKLAQNLFISASAISQAAALAAFEDTTLAELELRRQAFQVRRNFLIPALRKLGFEIPVEPDGAFYVYADIGRIAPNSYSWSQELLEKAAVAVTPGLDFGSNHSDRYVRFSYTTSVPRLQEGIARMNRFLSGGLG